MVRAVKQSAPGGTVRAWSEPHGRPRGPSLAVCSVPALPRITHKRQRRSHLRIANTSSDDEDNHDVPEPEVDRDDIRRNHIRKSRAVTRGARP